MRLFLQRKGILDGAVGGARGEINGRGGWKGNVNGAAMSGENVVATAGAITAVFDIATGSACSYALSGNVIELHGAAGRLNIDAADGEIFQRDWGRHAADTHVRPESIGDGNLPGSDESPIS